MVFSLSKDFCVSSLHNDVPLRNDRLRGRATVLDRQKLASHRDSLSDWQLSDDQRAVSLLPGLEDESGRSAIGCVHQELGLNLQEMYLTKARTLSSLLCIYSFQIFNADHCKFSKLFEKFQLLICLSPLPGL